jgi:hypothetical protein
VTVGTINAHGKIEAKAEIKGFTDTSASLKASAGAEAMAIDGHAGFEVSIQLVIRWVGSITAMLTQLLIMLQVRMFPKFHRYPTV